tara:strand:+ start:230 stop:610 length:381 start_codon:yes stop_codon:yes gene_type:complete
MVVLRLLQLLVLPKLPVMMAELGEQAKGLGGPHTAAAVEVLEVIQGRVVLEVLLIVGLELLDIMTQQAAVDRQIVQVVQTKLAAVVVALVYLVLRVTPRMVMLERLEVLEVLIMPRLVKVEMVKGM